MECTVCKSPIPIYRPFITIHPSVAADIDLCDDVCLDCVDNSLVKLKETLALSLHQFVSRRQYVTDIDNVEHLLRNSYGDCACDPKTTNLFCYPENLVIIEDEQHGGTYLALGNHQYSADNQEEFEAMEIVLYKYYLIEYCGISNAYDMEF